VKGETKLGDEGVKLEMAPPLPPSDPRVHLAAERTLLAWVRTGLSMMGFGFVVAKFGLFLQELAALRNAPPPHGGSLWLGVALVALGVVILLVAAGRYREYTRTLRGGQLVPAPGPTFGFSIAIFLALVGVAMVAYLLTVG
jgi:putative membrane protein